jgi:starch-binding outer membrane protein, SusD/RagB family
MKKSIILTTITLFLLSTSCSDFLEEELQGTYSSATFYKTEAHALLAVNSIYNIASFSSTDNALWVFGDVASDDAVKGGNPGDQSDIQFIDEFNYVRSNGYLEKTWKHYYEGISRANYLLYYGVDINMDEPLKARILGEAKFLRAYFYFNLVNIFGEIPLKTNPPLTDAEINVAKSPVTNIYAQIEKDLNEAAAALEPVAEGKDLGRATKGAALGLLAKSYLYQQKWNEVLSAIDQVDALGLYSLEPVYRNNFIDSTQNNQESIFEIQHLKGQTPKLGNSLNQWFSPVSENGYYFDVPVQNFINEFEKTVNDVVDPRLDYTVGREGKKWLNGEDFSASWSPTGYIQKKHIQPLREVSRGLKGDGDLNYVYLRYADILLMKAEALNEVNRTTDALIPLNAVRQRARESYLFDQSLEGFGSIPEGLLPDITDGGQLAVRNAIRHERRVELGFEFHRYFDLIRYGKQAAEAALGGNGFVYEQDRYFAIPQSELDTNPAISN